MQNPISIFLCILKGRHRTTKVAAMVDSGAAALFIDKKYADSQKMWQVPLAQQIRLHNIDRTLNEAGSITHKVSLILQVGQDEEKFDFFVTSLGPEKVILGLTMASTSEPCNRLASRHNEPQCRPGNGP
jgi:hypothetical protein